MRLAGFAFMLFLLQSAFSADTARVRVLVTDLYGSSFPADRIEFDSGSEVYVGNNDGTRVLPPGKYHVIVSVHGFSRWVDETTFHAGENTVRAGMHLGTFEGAAPMCTLAGKVDGLRGSANVRAIEAFGSHSTEVSVRKDGSYTLNGLDCGVYIIVVLQPSGCVAISTGQAEMVGGKAVDISMSSARCR